MRPWSPKRFSGKPKRLFFPGAGIQGRGEVPSRAPWSLVASVCHQAAARMETVIQATWGCGCGGFKGRTPWGRAAAAQPWS